MFENALIGIDELDGGPDATALARALSGPETALTLVRIHAGHASVARGGTHSLQDAERRTAEVALRRASISSGVPNAWAFGSTTVASGFETLAAHARADLVVLGSGLTGLPGETTISDIVLDTLPRVTSTVAIAPSGYSLRARPLRRIGVAYEETLEGQQALKLARQIGADHDAEVTVFEGFTNGIASRGVAADAARWLRDFSRTVDLLVIGARGGGSLRRLNHPTATPSLVRGVASPLLMVTAQTRLPRQAEHAAPERWTNKVTVGVRPL